MRAILPSELIDPGRVRDGAHECRVPGCRIGTSNGKPYCLEHLDRLPLARQLQSELVSLEDPCSELLADEILRWVARQGPTTIARLAVEFRIGSATIARRVRSLVREKRAFLVDLHDRHGRKRKVVKIP